VTRGLRAAARRSPRRAIAEGEFGGRGAQSPHVFCGRGESEAAGTGG
jgi:hypothetical protein